MIASAPTTVQCIPARLHRTPIAVLQPASTTPEPTHNPWATEVLIQLSRPRAFRSFSQAQRRFQRADEILRSAVYESIRRQDELRLDAEENLRNSIASALI